MYLNLILSLYLQTKNEYKWAVFILLVRPTNEGLIIITNAYVQLIKKVDYNYLTSSLTKIVNISSKMTNENDLECTM